MSAKQANAVDKAITFLAANNGDPDGYRGPFFDEAIRILEEVRKIPPEVIRKTYNFQKGVGLEFEGLLRAMFEALPPA